MRFLDQLMKSKKMDNKSNLLVFMANKSTPQKKIEPINPKLEEIPTKTEPIIPIISEVPKEKEEIVKIPEKTIIKKEKIKISKEEVVERDMKNLQSLLNEISNNFTLSKNIEDYRKLIPKFDSIIEIYQIFKKNLKSIAIPQQKGNIHEKNQRETDAILQNTLNTDSDAL